MLSTFISPSLINITDKNNLHLVLNIIQRLRDTVKDFYNIFIDFIFIFKSFLRHNKIQNNFSFALMVFLSIIL